jgi:hypothetical protein
MMMRLAFYAILVVGLISSSRSFAEDTKSSGSASVAETEIPVFEGDSNRPYRVIGEIKDNLRKHFAFQANPTKEKIYAELWERARKMGADAVIRASFGATKGTAFNHGRTPISGTAIKYSDVGD